MDPDFSNATAKEQIETGMMIINGLSLPFRAIDKGMNAACNSTETTQKVCRAIGTGFKGTANFVGSYIPSSVKSNTSNLINRLNVEVPRAFERQYGIPQSDTRYALSNAGIVAGGVALAGVGKAVGSMAKAGLASIKANNAVIRASSAATSTHPIVTNVPRYNSSLSYITTSSANQTVVNANHAFLSNTINKIKTPLGDQGGFLNVSYMKRTDGSITAFVHLLKSTSNASVGQATKTSGTAFQAISTIQSYARKEGASSLYIQWNPANKMLFSLAGRSKNLTYIGNGMFPGLGSWPVFKLNSYKKELGIGLSLYGLSAYNNGAFAESVQLNHLTDSFNGANPDHPIAEHGASGGDVGGVEQKISPIGLFSQYNQLKEKWHVFHINAPDGKLPVKREHTLQLARESAIGIYSNGSISIVSEHFNPCHEIYLVIPPEFEHTLTGKVMSLLDYYMKSFYSGGGFHPSILEQWQHSRTRDVNALKPLMIDWHEYCAEHLPNEHYYSLWEMLDILEQYEKVQESNKEGTSDPSDPKETPKPLESTLLSDYSGFSSSVRIIFKQNRFVKTNRLISLNEGDFDVLYTISPDAAYAEELRKYHLLFGHDPAGYKRLVQANEWMCDQIRTMMPRLPIFRELELFEMAKQINFFAYYFTELKLAHKAPLFKKVPIDQTAAALPVFPPHPIRKISRSLLKINFEKVFEKISAEDKEKIIQFLRKAKKEEEPSEEILKLITPSMKKHLEETSTYFSQKSPVEKHKNLIQDLLKHLVALIHDSHENARNECQEIKNLESQSKPPETEPKQDPNIALDPQLERMQNIQFLTNKISFYETKLKELEEDRKKGLSLVGKVPQDKLDEALKVNQSSIDVFTKIISAFKKLNDIVEDPIAYSIKNSELPLSLSQPTIQLFTEQTVDEQDQTKRVVGGCGLNLEPKSIQIDPMGQDLLNQNYPELLSVEDEEFIPLEDKRTGKTDSYAFKLHFTDFHASEDREYDWMQFSMTQDDPKTEQQKTEVFSALQQDNLDTFKKVIKRKGAQQFTDCHGVSLIHYAAASNSPAYLQEMVQQGADVTVADRFGRTPLHVAAELGLVKNIQILLQKAPQLLNAQAKSQVTPLHAAVQNGQIEAVKTLLAAGADPNVVTTYGMTALYSAVHHGHEAIALELLKFQNTNPNLYTEDGTSPLYVAVELEMPEVIKQLMIRGANLNHCRKDGYAPIHVAAKKGSEAVCRLLLEQPGIQVNLPLKSGNTALHLAAESNSPNIVHLLLKFGADLTIYGWEQKTALLAAIRNGKTDAARIIMAYAKEKNCVINRDNNPYRIIDCPDIRGITPLNVAVESHFHSILEALLNEGVTIPNPFEFLLQLCRVKIDPQFIHRFIKRNNFSREQISAAYYAACKHGHNQMVSLFWLFYGGDDFLDEKKQSLIDYAAQYDHVNIIQKFLAMLPEEVLQISIVGKTVAYIAAENGSSRALELILKAMSEKGMRFEDHHEGRHLLYGAVHAGKQSCVELIIRALNNPNVPIDADGRSATHIAAMNGDVEMLELLRKQGVSFDLRDKLGKTPFHYAFENNWEDAIDYLMDKKYEIPLPPDLLHFVAGKGTSKQIQLLLKRGYDPNFTPSTKDHPLFHALRENNLEGFITLCKSGANLEARAEEKTPLLMASSNGKLHFLKYIWESTRKSHTTASGYNALHLATHFGHDDCVTYLINAGFDATLGNGSGKTSLDIAKRNRHDHLVFLFQNGYKKYKELKEDIVQAAILDDDRRFFKLVKGFPSNSLISFNIEGKEESITLPYLIYLLGPKTSNKILTKLREQKGIKFNTKIHNGQTIFHLMAKRKEKLDFSQIDPLLQDQVGASVLHLCAANTPPDHFKESLKQCNDVDIEDNCGATPLFYAIVVNKQENVESLLEKGAKPNHLTKLKQSPLLYATEKHLPLVIQTLLKYGADINQRCLGKGTTPLLFALRKGILDKGKLENEYFEIVKLLIANGADVNLGNEFGVRPIHLVAQQGNIALFQLLEAAGSSLHYKDIDGLSIAHYAAQSKNPAIIDYLRERGIPLHKPSKIKKVSLRKSHPQTNGITSLHRAAEEGRLAMVKKLVETGADVEAVTESDCSAYYYAVKSKNRALIDYFSDFRIASKDEEKANAIIAAIAKDDPTILKSLYGDELPSDLTLNYQGQTGLQAASTLGAMKSTRYFLDKKADPGKANLQGETPLDLSVEQHHLNHTDYLVHECDKSALCHKLKEGKTLLHKACESGDAEMAALLIGKGLNIDEIDDHGWTPLHYAAKNGDYPLVHLLLAAGADCDKKTPEALTIQHFLQPKATELKNLIDLYRQAGIEGKKNRESRLHLAIRLNDFQHFPLLLKLDDVNTPNKYGKTPLHLAVIKKKKNFIMELIEAGALLELQDNKGRTPLFWAATLGKDLDIVQYLLKLGADVRLENREGESLLLAISKRSDKELATRLFNLIFQYLLLWQESKKSTDKFTSAIKNNDEKAFFRKINHGAYRQIRDKDPSLLFLAVESDADKILAPLIHWFRFDPTQKDPQGSSLEKIAYSSNKKKVFHVLYGQALKRKKSGSKIETVIANDDLPSLLNFSDSVWNLQHISPENGNSYLHEAAKIGSVNVAKFLVWFGLDYKAVNKRGNTPLHISASLQREMMTEYSLSHDIDPLSINAEGWTPLSLSLQKQINPRIVELFKTKNVQINPKINSVSQLELAIQKNKVEIFKNFLRLGVETLPFTMKKEDKSELMQIIKARSIPLLKAYCEIAVEKKNERMLQELRRLYLYGVKNQPSYLEALYEFSEISGDKQMTNAVSEAIKAGQLKSLIFLINKGQPLTWPNQTFGENPLYLALKKENREMVKAIYEQLVKMASEAVAVEPFDGPTELTKAIEKGTLEPFISVFVHGFSLDKLEDKGNCYIELARTCKRAEMVKYLNLLQ